MANKQERVIKHYFMGVKREAILRHKTIKRSALILVYKGRDKNYYITFGQLLRVSAGQSIPLPQEVKEGIVNLEGQ
jgi:hypothetical protein